MVEQPLCCRDGVGVVGCSLREVHLKLLPIPDVLDVVDLGVAGKHLGPVHLHHHAIPTPKFWTYTH